MSSLSAVSVANYSDSAYSRSDVNEQERVKSGRQFIANLLPVDGKTTKAEEDAGSVQAIPKEQQQRQVSQAMDTVSQFASVQNLKLQDKTILKHVAIKKYQNMLNLLDMLILKSEKLLFLKIF